MSYFIFEGVLECGRRFELGKQEARHLLKSRRLRAGERFLIQDQKGQRYDAVLERCSHNHTTFIPEFPVSVPAPSILQIEILQALTKEKAINWILQKSTELGANRLDFFCATYSPNSFHNLQHRNQLTRWNRIVLEASKQCGRQFPPEIFWHENLETALKTIKECKNSWILSPRIEHSISWKKIDNSEENLEMRHRLLVGPEGGFHENEIDLALRSGMKPVDLGPRIMRSETATVTAVSILQFLWGDI